ncbi:MAG: acyl carrier protein [Gemmatimonadetes bacterium]|nr:acyl carrier protein [Gemmatimonadota bacterium]
MTAEKIRTFITQMSMDASGSAIADDTPLLDSGVMDSMGVLELVTFLESEFGVKVQDEEIVPENFETVVRIAAFVESKKRG